MTAPDDATRRLHEQMLRQAKGMLGVCEAHARSTADDREPGGADPAVVALTREIVRACGVYLGATTGRQGRGDRPRRV